MSGIVIVLWRTLVDRTSSIQSRCGLTPLGYGGNAVLLEDVATVEVTVVVEVVVDRGVRGGKFL